MNRSPDEQRMLFSETDIDGAFLIEPEPRVDDRGFFARMFCTAELAERGLAGNISQVNTGFSPRAGTLRGLHFQLAPHAEVKIARCLRGSVFDVAVDLRDGSPTYKRWTGHVLSADNGKLLYVPAGCAHGYLTLLPDTELMYFTSAPYAPAAGRGIRYNDPAFAIEWPAKVEVISTADSSWPAFAG
jgi:dTDP-4-dehydrorhamnose 3,5-epimerase